MKSKCILFSVMIMLLGCGNVETKQSKEEEREYKEILCPKCDGTGTQPQTTAQKIGFAICSFGMTLMCDDEQSCSKCGGVGTIKIPVIK